MANRPLLHPILKTLGYGLVVAVVVCGAVAVAALGHRVWGPGSLAVAAGIGLVVFLAASFVKNRLRASRRRVLDRLRASVRRTAVLQRQVSALNRVNGTLAERVVNQTDSMTMLRDQVRKLATLSLDQALETLLETVRLFTGMTSGSVYVLNPERGSLEMAASVGWVDTDFPWEVPLEGSVVGYVYRNGKPFSLRMMLDGPEFSTFTVDHNLMTYPIRVQGRVWGVLNLEKLPFERYSSYTESILEIILGLMEPTLADTVEHDLLRRQSEIDDVTGFPLAGQFFHGLDDELERAGRDRTAVAVVVLEVTNWTTLVEATSRAAVKKSLAALKPGVLALNAKARLYHFREENQLAVVVPGLDQDGTSFFGLELLSMVSRSGLEVIVGFSSAKGDTTGERLVAAAEHLLSLQRL